MVAWRSTVVVLGLGLGCGQTHSNPRAAAGGMPASAGSDANAGAAVAAGGSGSSVPGCCPVAAGGVNAAGVAGSVALQGGTSTGGSAEPSAGAAGEAAGAAGAGGEPNPIEPLDYAWARWPMPNTVASGLPHPMSYDLSVADIVKDNVTGLEWQRAVGAAALSYSEAINYCGGLTLGGRDWRLPTRIELVSLQAYAGPALGQPGVFETNGGNETFWSSSLDPNNLAWGVLAFGEFALPANLSNSVRCVHAPRASVSPGPHYTVLGGTVLDNWTGLSWQRAPAEVWDTQDQQEAMCAALSLDGHADWRMPSLKELLTLVDETKVYPALDTVTFPGKDSIVSGWFWSSTLYAPVAGHAPEAPGLRFADGTVLSQGGTTFPLLGRCVR